LKVNDIIQKVFVPELEKRLSLIYGEKIKAEIVVTDSSGFEWKLPSDLYFVVTV